MDVAYMLDDALSFRSTGRTHIGKVRKLNEDIFLTRPDLGLWAVADGMGGHERGDIAAARIADALDCLDEGLAGDKLVRATRATLETENMKLYAMGADIAPNKTMGATFASLIINDDGLTCLWAGDSRVYRLRGGVINQLTKDHSLVQDMVDAGELTPDEAESHPMRNVVTRALGAGRTVEIDTHHDVARSGDVFLITTDGVTTMCDDAELAGLLTSMEMEEAADALVALCLERGARDNLSFVIVEAH